jgi:hypothetical protein
MHGDSERGSRPGSVNLMTEEDLKSGCAVSRFAAMYKCKNVAVFAAKSGSGLHRRIPLTVASSGRDPRANDIWLKGQIRKDVEELRRIWRRDAVRVPMHSSVSSHPTYC